MTILVILSFSSLSYPDIFSRFRALYFLFKFVLAQRNFTSSVVFHILHMPSTIYLSFSFYLSSLSLYRICLTMFVVWPRIVFWEFSLGIVLPLKTRDNLTPNQLVRSSAFNLCFFSKTKTFLLDVCNIILWARLATKRNEERRFSHYFCL